MNVPESGTFFLYIDGRQTDLAVTKLMHMKEAPAVPHRHLANAVKYILDEKNNEAKTCDGLYVGGNAGYDSEDIIKTFLDTKELYGKMHGRQGYHFVISFEPGETDADEAYKITKEFAKKYLGENYDYVFATHTDKNHIHSHLIFNSVSRTDGYKYRYENGDWERYIQPVTDEICMEHGLKPLKFEENKKKGLSYAEWNEKKNGRMNWTHVIRADIDLALKHSDTLPEFMEHMKMAGYSVRAGKSKKKNTTYFTYTYTDVYTEVYRINYVYTIIGWCSISIKDFQCMREGFGQTLPHQCSDFIGRHAIVRALSLPCAYAEVEVVLISPNAVIVIITCHKRLRIHE